MRTSLRVFSIALCVTVVGFGASGSRLAEVQDPLVASILKDAQFDRLRAFWSSRYGDLASRLPLDTDTYVASLLARAKPDECYHGIGAENVYPFDFDHDECSGRPRVSESYVFGLTRAGDDLWFGSAPNMGCLVYGTIADQGIPGGLIEFEGQTWTCEYAASRYGDEQGLPDHLGDWRPPSIYTYDLVSGELERREIDDPLLDETLGIRSAGTLGNIVFLAGPYLTGMGPPDVDGAVHLFAFRADTGQYLGSRRYPEYLNIRKWIEIDGSLYTGVMVNKGLYADPEAAPGGAILRWTGSESDPFDFEVVGWVDGDPAELALHDGRLFASTWPDFSQLFGDEYDHAGIWMSPPIAATGLSPADADAWTKVWSAADYEQDDVVARMYNGGALASYGGYLYWGTTHAPLSAGLAHAQFYGLIDADSPEDFDFQAVTRAITGTHRPISLFRGRGFGTAAEQTEVLYGLEEMPAYVLNPDPGGPDRIWQVLPNRMGAPRFGPAGVGNLFATYTWTMAVYNDALFVGAMDWSHMLMAVMLPAILRDVIYPMPEIEMPGMDFGGDLFVFPTPESPALKLSRDGVHNHLAYGVRTMLATDDGLLLGMANSSNLATDPGDRRPEGGWELHRLTLADCETSGVRGDMNGDGRVNLRDLRKFLGCRTGPCRTGDCDLPLYDDPCCAAGDFDGDGDIDRLDARAFLAEILPCNVTRSCREGSSAAAVGEIGAEAGTAPSPKQTILFQNTPNPFNPATDIRFDLAQDSHVELRIYDAAGRQVRTLINETMSSGSDQRIAWDGRDDHEQRLPSGVYLYRLAAGDYTATRKMLMIR